MNPIGFIVIGLGVIFMIVGFHGSQSTLLKQLKAAL
jgi:hypothetical protein